MGFLYVVGPGVPTSLELVVVGAPPGSVEV